jgi:hypothetical protein
MEQRNCKNCGAPIEHSFNHKCPYCGTLFDFNVNEKDITKVEPRELREIRLVDITNDYITNSLIFKFKGFKLCEPIIYEHNSQNEFVSSAFVEQYLNPPMCGFILDIPLNDLRENGLASIEWRLHFLDIEPKEINHIMSEIEEKIWNEKLNIKGV